MKEEIKKADPGTFGSEKEYPSLAYLHSNLFKIDKARREYVGSLLSDVHVIVKAVTKIDPVVRDYFVNLARKDFVAKVDNCNETIEDKAFVSHLKNYVSTRFKVELSTVKKYSDEKR